MNVALLRVYSRRLPLLFIPRFSHILLEITQLGLGHGYISVFFSVFSAKKFHKMNRIMILNETVRPKTVRFQSAAFCLVEHLMENINII